MKNNKLVGEFDARVWAKEFLDTIVNSKKQITIDESLMIGWFANAIMAGYDKAKADYEKKLNNVEKGR